jgi:hypothetical protein
VQAACTYWRSKQQQIHSFSVVQIVLDLALGRCYTAKRMLEPTSKRMKSTTNAPREESISGILREAPKVHDAFGGVGGFVLMLWALWVARRRGRWLLTVSAGVSYFGVKWVGWI